jgi:hypothetical protein
LRSCFGAVAMARSRFDDHCGVCTQMSTTPKTPCPSGYYCPNATVVLPCPAGRFCKWYTKFPRVRSPFLAHVQADGCRLMCHPCTWKLGW